MGGRGGSSGLVTATGFSYKFNEKTVIVQKNSAGVVLINGNPNRNISYEKLMESARGKTDFKKLSASDLEEIRKKRHKNYQSHDYELMGNKSARKSVYRPKRRR